MRVISRRFRDRAACETLIRSNVLIYLSSKIDGLAKDNGLKIRGFHDIFKVLKRSFEQRKHFFNLLLRAYGGEVSGLDDVGHYRELLDATI